MAIGSFASVARRMLATEVVRGRRPTLIVYTNVIGRVQAAVEEKR